MSLDVVTSAQIRAARGLLNWTVRDLAEKAGVHRNTVTRIETDANGQGHAMASIMKAFDDAGVEFIDGGVRADIVVRNVATGETLAIEIKNGRS